MIHSFNLPKRKAADKTVFTASVHLAEKNRFNGNIAKPNPFHPDAAFPYF